MDSENIAVGLWLICASTRTLWLLVNKSFQDWKVEDCFFLFVCFTWKHLRGFLAWHCDSVMLLYVWNEPRRHLASWWGPGAYTILTECVLEPVLSFAFGCSFLPWSSGNTGPKHHLVRPNWGEFRGWNPGWCWMQQGLQLGCFWLRNRGPIYVSTDRQIH